jgi:hypothetical protein
VQTIEKHKYSEFVVLEALLGGATSMPEWKLPKWYSTLHKMTELVNDCDRKCYKIENYKGTIECPGLKTGKNISPLISLLKLTLSRNSLAVPGRIS